VGGRLGELTTDGGLNERPNFAQVLGTYSDCLSACFVENRVGSCVEKSGEFCGLSVGSVDLTAEGVEGKDHLSNAGKIPERFQLPELLEECVENGEVGVLS